MSRYLVRRLLQLGVVFLGVALLVFVMVRLAGDPAELLLPPDATQIQVEELRQALGLDKPLYLQFVRFVLNAVRGNMGISYYCGEPAMKLVLERVPATLQLAGFAMVLAVVLSVPLSVMAAVHKGSLLDRLVLVLSLFGISAPTFWIGILLIYVFAVALRWFPSSGLGGFKHLILPGTTLSLYYLALFIRLNRAGMLDVLSRDYVTTARAKGLPERTVLYKHALKNTLIPFVTIGGLQLGGLIAFSIVTEKVFAWPGMGRLLLEAIEKLDYPVIIAYVLVTAFLFGVLNLIVDITYTFLDPRVRYN